MWNEPVEVACKVYEIRLIFLVTQITQEKICPSGKIRSHWGEENNTVLFVLILSILTPFYNFSDFSLICIFIVGFYSYLNSVL